MSIPFRVAVVGVGHWHAPRYLEFLAKQGERIVAVWDRDPAVAANAAAETGARTGQGLSELLRETNPDVVFGMGIHAEMPALLAAMMETPAALVLEKPLGIHAADVAPLVERAEREGRFAAVAFTQRTSPLWEKVDELAAAGRLGRPCYAHFRVINGAPERYVRDGVGWMLDRAQSGGGSLINLGTHTLDAFNRFVGGEAVAVVSAQLGYLAHGAPVEDYALAVLRSASGVLASVESGYCYPTMAPGGDQEWRLITSNAYITQRADTLLVQTLDDGKLERLPGREPGDPYESFVADVLHRLRAGLPPAATLRDGLKVLQLVDAIYQAAGR